MARTKQGRIREPKKDHGGGTRAAKVALSFFVSLVPVLVIILQPQSITFDDYISEKVKIFKISNVSTRLAYVQSFGFFDDIPDAAWKGMQRRARTAIRYRNVTFPEDGFERPGWWYAHNLQPNFGCFNMERVGGLDDGPKWTCDPHRLLQRPNCLIYSIGSAGQYQWELGLVRRLGSHCEIHVFDPGNYSKPELAPNVHYHQWGLKSSYDSNYTPSLYKGIEPMEMLTFQETLSRLNHQNRVIDIFKLDCERCEWSSYKDWMGGKIRQLIIESPTFMAEESA
eukprot:scaffold1818_cov162-Amphora_coffeaeformis.AAC.10